MTLKFDVMLFWDNHICMGSWTLEERNKLFPKELKFLDFQRHKGELVLDAGCGAGFDTQNMVNAGCNVVAVDFSLESLRVAHRNCGTANCIQCDIENLPFRSRVFDFAISLGVLHHTPNTEKDIEELKRVVKRNGRCIIMFYNRLYLILHRLLGRVGRFELKYDDPGCPLIKFYTITEIRCKYKIQVFRAFGNRIWIPHFGKLIHLPDSLERYFGFGIYAGWQP